MAKKRATSANAGKRSTSKRRASGPSSVPLEQTPGTGQAAKVTCGPERDDGDIILDLEFAAASVRVRETPFGVVIDLPDGVKSGSLGGPALPVVPLEVALRPGMTVKKITVEAGEAVLLSRSSFIAPLQPAAPGVRRCPPEVFMRDDGLVKAWPRPPFVPPIPELYERLRKRPGDSVVVSQIDATGLQPVATVVVRPIQVNERGQPTLVTRFRIRLQLTPDEVGEEWSSVARFSSAAQVERWSSLAKSRVVNPRDVIDFGSKIGRLLPADYLIITDNTNWNAETVTPATALSGDVVAEFQRLAAWKRLKGLSARVVTVSEIVNGTYGTFHGGCRRDLQEVIREFVKWAHAHWGTAWLLLGGDIGVIPARSVVGYVGGFDPGTTDPPDAAGSFWTGAFLKVRASGLNADTPLIRAGDGHRVPYDATGASSTTRLGWYFTDSTYSTRSTMPTQYIRVNGPAAQANTRLFWLTNDNTIPSDLYYADVAGYPERSANGTWVSEPPRGPLGGLMFRLCGGHDWDAVGNRLYGQWNDSQDLDGVRYVADLSVGRAPVASAAEAKAFVDKAIAYEQQGGLFYSSAWLRKVLMVSSNWGGRTGYWPASPLADDSYSKLASANHAVIQLSAAPSSFNLRLLSHVSDNDERELPFRLDASPTQRGWYYSTGASSTTPSKLTIPLPFIGNFTLPIPSRWIVVFGAAAEMSPAFFVLDDSAADGSMLDQETLRTQLAADLPWWSDVARLYEDDVDLPPANVGAAPIAHLSESRLQTALQAGVHVVSLSGHGNWWGCCNLGPTLARDLTNGRRTFIGYADSCLTNEFDVEDAVSETLLQNAGGGAVAYVGNTRFSWIGVGDDFQRNFFKGLLSTRALGTLHDRRLSMLTASTGFWPVYNRWTIHSLNLMGDPEMRVWTFSPWRLCLELPESVRVRGTLHVQVLHGNAPVGGAVVTIQQDTGLWAQRRSDSMGNVSFDLAAAQVGKLTVTAVHPNAAVTQTSVDVRGSRWLDAEVLAVLAEGAHARVLLRSGQGDRHALIGTESAAMLALLSGMVGTGRRVHVQLIDDDVIEAVEVREG